VADYATAPSSEELNAPPPAACDARGAAIHLGLSPSTIRRLIAAGRLPVVRIGGRVLLRYADLDEFLAASAAEVPNV